MKKDVLASPGILMLPEPEKLKISTWLLMPYSENTFCAAELAVEVDTLLLKPTRRSSGGSRFRRLLRLRVPTPADADLVSGL